MGGMAMLGGNIASGLFGFLGSNKASKQQAETQRMALQMQQGMFNKVADLITPFANAGSGMLPTLTGLLTPGANQTEILKTLPGFQFASDWGERAIKNMGSMRGLGGNVLKAGADYAGGLASTQFGSLVDKIQALVGMGSNAAAGLGGAAGNFGSMMGNTLTNMGNAQAAGTMGGYNALGGIGNTIGNTFMLDKLTGGQMFGGGGGGGMYGSGNSFFPGAGFMNNSWGW